jgi:hypothetical protein
MLYCAFVSRRFLRLGIRREAACSPASSSGYAGLFRFAIQQADKRPLQLWRIPFPFHARILVQPHPAINTAATSRPRSSPPRRDPHTDSFSPSRSRDRVPLAFLGRLWVAGQSRSGGGPKVPLSAYLARSRSGITRKFWGEQNDWAPRAFGPGAQFAFLSVRRDFRLAFLRRRTTGAQQYRLGKITTEKSLGDSHDQAVGGG